MCRLLSFSPEGVHGLREELVERGVAHAVDLALARGGGGRRVPVLRHHRVARRPVDVREAERRVAGQLRVNLKLQFVYNGSSYLLGQKFCAC